MSVLWVLLSMTCVAVGSHAATLDKAVLAAESRTADVNLNIKMCYYCDANCIAYIGTSKTDSASVYTYLRSVTALIETKLNTIPGYSFTLVPHYAWLMSYDKRFLYWKGKSFTGSGVSLMGDVSTNFWNVWKFPGADDKTLTDIALEKGCDAEFLLVDPYDSLWNYGDGVSAVANMMGICSKQAFGMVKANKNVERMATLMAHEFGHIMGMFHDGNLDQSYGMCDRLVTISAGVITPAMCDTLREQCTARTHHCADGQQNCVMSAAVGRETKYSGCSKAYLDMYTYMAKALPTMYSFDCVTEDGKRHFDDNEEAEKMTDDQNASIDMFLKRASKSQMRRSDGDQIPPQNFLDLFDAED